MFLAEFQWLESKRFNDQDQLEVEEVIKGMERLSSNEVVSQGGPLLKSM